MIQTSDPNVLMVDIRGWAYRQARAVALELIESLYEATPVDTGFAQSNWVADTSLNQGIYGSKNAIDSGEYIASLAIISTWNPEANPNMFISNSVPYISKLNDGWSAQAPAGFIEEAVARAESVGEVE